MLVSLLQAVLGCFVLLWHCVQSLWPAFVLQAQHHLEKVCQIEIAALQQHFLRQVPL